VQIGMEIFKAGDFGEFLRLSFQVGLGKAETIFLNFSTKVSAGLLAGLSEALAQFTNNLPILKQIFAQLWAYVKAGFFSILGTLTKGFGLQVNFWIALFLKGIEEIREAWSKFTGGNFKARELITIVEQEFDNSTISKLGDKFALMGKEASDVSAVTAKEIKDALVPAVQAVGKATKDAFTGTANIAEDSEATVKAQADLNALIEKSAKVVDEANKKTEQLVQQTANSGDLPANEGTGKNNNGDNGGALQSVGQIIATGLARIGGGGNVQQTQVNLLSDLLRTAREQVNETKMQTSALEEIGLGEVR